MSVEHEVYIEVVNDLVNNLDAAADEIERLRTDLAEARAIARRWFAQAPARDEPHTLGNEYQADAATIAKWRDG